MKRTAALVLGIILTLAATVPALAHPFTIKGTVAAATATKLSVKIKDDKTGKMSVTVFDMDKETKILRGDDVVTFAAAKIQKDEQVSVTVNLDDGETLADVVRLASKKK